MYYGKRGSIFTKFKSYVQHCLEMTNKKDQGS